MEYTAERQLAYTLITLSEAGLDAHISTDIKMLAVSLTKEEGVRNMLFNLEHCTSCDDSGLSALLIANRLCKIAGGRFAVTGVCSAIAQQIHAYQLEIVLHILNAPEEADGYFTA